MNEILWTDTHCHLDARYRTDDSGDDSGDDALDAILINARAAGVSRFVTVGCDLASSRECIDVASKYDDVWATVGVHPHEAEGGLDGILELLTSSRVVAGPPADGRRKQPFLAGLHAERLFWRSMQGRPIVSSLVLHACEIARHAIARAPFGTAPMLAGRFVALMQFGSYLQRYRQLRSIARSAAEREATSEATTIRIDGPHAAASRPHRRPETVPLRRSA